MWRNRPSAYSISLAVSMANTTGERPRRLPFKIFFYLLFLVLLVQFYI